MRTIIVKLTYPNWPLSKLRFMDILFNLWLKSNQLITWLIMLLMKYLSIKLIWNWKTIRI